MTEVIALLLLDVDDGMLGLIMMLPDDDYDVTDDSFHFFDLRNFFGVSFVLLFCL